MHSGPVAPAKQRIAEDECDRRHAAEQHVAISEASVIWIEMDERVDPELQQCKHYCEKRDQNVPSHALPSNENKLSYGDRRRAANAIWRVHSSKTTLHDGRR
jgi:hypothetical protein